MPAVLSKGIHSALSREERAGVRDPMGPGKSPHPVLKPSSERQAVATSVAGVLFCEAAGKPETSRHCCHVSHKCATPAKICVTKAHWRLYASHSR
jgi:hypothetical protein